MCRSFDDLDRLFAQIQREKGKLDVVFANAVGRFRLPRWARSLKAV